MKVMKVLWFSSTPCSAIDRLDMRLYFGSWLRSLEEELAKLAEIELSVCFYSTKKMEMFEYNCTSYYPVFRRRYSTKVGRALYRFSKRNNDSDELRALLDVIKVVNPDIIHVHGTEDNFGLVQEYTRKPVVISIQGILTPYSQKYYSGIPEPVASKYENMISKLTALSSGIQYERFIRNSIREQSILKNSRYLIGRTRWDRQVTTVLAPQSHYYTANEMLRPVFYTTVWNKARFNDPLEIVTTSSDSLYKGFETIVNTAQILRQHGKLNFRWKVIGLSADSSIVRIVTRWKKVNPMHLNIELLGSKNQEEIAKILSLSDIYCQVSHIENSPNSLCEAMMIGVPSIASGCGGTTSMLEDGREGFLFQEGDAYSLAGLILNVESNFLRASEMAAAAKKAAELRHEKAAVLSQVIKIYRTIIDNEAGKI
jgi:glycosyltransferase involved in cell wall biosynthesis